MASKTVDVTEAESHFSELLSLVGITTLKRD